MTAASGWRPFPGGRPGRVVAVGDVMTDIFVRPEGPMRRATDRAARIESRPGGSACNLAAWLAFHGAVVTLAARVGADEAERHREALLAAGVEPHLAVDPERPTGRNVVVVGADGERSFYADRAANLALAPEDLPEALLDDAALVVLSGYSAVGAEPRRATRAFAEAARRRGVPVWIDPASAGFIAEIGAPAFLGWAAGADAIFPNTDEAALIGAGLVDGAATAENVRPLLADPEAACAALARRARLAVVTLGAEGALAAVAGERWRTPGVAVPAVVDTTGAGDAFLAAFAAAALAGATIEAALAAGAAAGALAVGIAGGRPPERTTA